jgi:hypothetical protein
LPVAVEPVKATFADVGMARQSLTKIVLIDDDIDHAGRQYCRTEFAEAEGSYGQKLVTA